MSPLLQNLIVLAILLTCATALFMSARRALSGRKSAIGGCGSCSGCATQTSTPGTQKKKSAPLQMVSLDSLSARIKTRPKAPATRDL